MPDRLLRVKPLAAAATAALLITALAGCVGSDTVTPGTSSSSRTPKASAPATATATPGATDATETTPGEAPDPAQLKCLTVDQSAIDVIAQGLLSGVTVNTAAAHLATDDSGVFYVTLDLVGAGAESGQAVATFATNDDPSVPGGEGITIAVGEAAHQFSDWPRGEESDFQLTSDSPGVAESVACLGL